jgi:hypothetical protein
MFGFLVEDRGWVLARMILSESALGGGLETALFILPSDRSFWPPNRTPMESEEIDHRVFQCFYS